MFDFFYYFFFLYITLNNWYLYLRYDISSLLDIFLKNGRAEMIITDTGIIVSLAPPTPAPTHTQTNHQPPCLICLTWIFKSFTCISRVLKKTFIMSNKINTIFHQIYKIPSSSKRVVWCWGKTSKVASLSLLLVR